MAVIDELVTILGLEAAPGAKAAVATIQGGLEKVTNVAMIAGAALTAAAASIGFMVNRFSQQGAEIAKLASTTGMTTDEIQQLSFAADKAGVSSQNLIGDIKNLTKSMHSPIPGEFNQGLFMLGISTRKASGELKTGSDVLLDLADKFQGMNEVKAMNWASKVGISEDTLILLKEGRSAIRDYMKQAEAFTVPPEAIEASKKFQIQLTTVNRIFQYVGQTITASLVPIFDKYLRTFSEFILQNKEFINLGLKTVTQGIADGFTLIWETLVKLKDFLFETIPGLETFTEALIDANNISQILYGTFLVIAAVLAVMFAKFIFLAGAIGAVVVIVEDLITYFRDGESITGKLIEKIQALYSEFATSFPNIVKFAEAVWDILSKIGGWAIGEIIDGLKTFWGYLKDIANELKVIIGVFLQIANVVAGFLVGIPEKISALKESVSGMFSGIGDMIPDSIKGLIGFEQNKDGQKEVLVSETKTAQPINNYSTNNQSQANKTTTVNQYIQGGNSLEVAEESARRFQMMDIYGGDLAPNTQ